MKFLANAVIVVVVAMLLGGPLFLLSWDYPHAWMPITFCCLVVWFFARATWLPTIPYRILACSAVCLNITSLFLISSVQRMNIFQRERPPALQYMLIGGGILTVATLFTMLPIPKGKKKAAVLVFGAVLMASFIGYISSSQGGPNPMIAFFQHKFGLSASGAETATILVRKTIHFTFYGTFGLLLYLAMRSAKPAPQKALLIALGGVLALACFDEIRQTTADFRTGSPWDVCLDMAGAATFCLTAAATKRVRSQ